jgi:hypothetical protein
MRFLALIDLRFSYSESIPHFEKKYTLAAIPLWWPAAFAQKHPLAAIWVRGNHLAAMKCGGHY